MKVGMKCNSYKAECNKRSATNIYLIGRKNMGWAQCMCSDLEVFNEHAAGDLSAINLLDDQILRRQ